MLVLAFTCQTQQRSSVKAYQAAEKNILNTYGREICGESILGMLKGDEKKGLCSGIYQEVPVADSEVSVMLLCNELRGTHWYRERRDCGFGSFQYWTTNSSRAAGRRTNCPPHKHLGFNCFCHFLSHAGKRGFPLLRGMNTGPKVWYLTIKRLEMLDFPLKIKKETTKRPRKWDLKMNLALGVGLTT